MRGKTLILLVCIFLSGCTSAERLTRLKDRNENVVNVEITGNIQEAKEIIPDVCRELKLIPRPSAETENFILCNSNKLKISLLQAVSGGIGSATYATQLGFFLDYNVNENMTSITISEEISSLGDPKRFIIADKIKLKQLELK